MSRSRRAIVPALVAVVLAAIWPGIVRAERFPLRYYSSVDGLAGDYVIDIYRDHRGFLWFSTRDGLSRFDGTRFRSYTLADGLPRATINAVLETRDGLLWIATNGGGVCVFQPEGPSRFRTLAIGTTAASNRINVLFEDATGRLWAGTDSGAFVRASGSADFLPVDLGLSDDVSLHGVADIAPDATGSLWFSGGFGVRRRLPDGRVLHYRDHTQSAPESATALYITVDQRIWVGFRRGLHTFTAEPLSQFDTEPVARDRPLTGRWHSVADGLPAPVITAIHQSADGEMWVGTTGGLAHLEDGRFRAYRGSSGLPGAQVSDLAEDASGNLWIGTVAGAARLVRHGMVTFTEADGLAHSRIHSLGEDPSGALVVVSGAFQLSRFDAGRFTSIRPVVAADATCTWMSPCAHMDPTGAWWMLTTEGLVHALAGTAGARRALPAVNVFTAFSDSRGRLWVSGSLGGLRVRDPVTHQWRTLSDKDGLPPSGSLASRVNALAEDRSGGVWVGFEGGGLARERAGRFERFGQEAGVPAGSVSALYVDAAGRMWMATTQAGLGRIDAPLAASINVSAFTEKDGLGSNNVRTIVEDQFGRLYAGHSRGVDRIVTATGEVTHYTVSEGLGSQFVTSSHRDRSGALWFGTMSGLSRLVPAPGATSTRDTPAPPVLISSVRAAGVPQPLSDLGEAAPARFELSASRSSLDIEFFALNYAAGEPLRFQYRLQEGDEAWSVPTDQRSVHLASLAPRTYTFQVRAVRPDGATSKAPAIVTFTVRPPWYATWWFVTGVCLIATAVAAGGYRMRVAQLLRVERVRSRIATDLHDDIGASLSQIAILSEVARQRMRAPAGGADVSEPLARIADTSRSLVGAMSDIVWAINPEVDALSDLVHRMRRFVEDTLGALDVDVTFTAPDSGDDMRLGADIRREVFLILKESVNNIAKHAGCRTATIVISADRRRLLLDVRDDGRGFDPALETDGNGVASMRRRVAALGGRLTITSEPGLGTRVQLDVSLSGPSRGLLHP